MDKLFFTKNRRNLMDKIEDNSLVVMFAGNAPLKSADENYNFTPNRNFYYLTGIDRENMLLLMSKRNNKVEETLFIEKSDPILAKWVGEKMSGEEAKGISGIESTEYVEAFNGNIHKYLNSNNFNKLYLNLEKMNFDSPASKAHEFAKTVTEKYPYVKIDNVFPLISALRTIKSDEEVEYIKEAIEITKEGIKNIMKNAGPGMMEYELEAYFDFTIKSKGIKDYAFNTIAASGKNATVLHYGKNHAKTNDNDLILFDLGAQYRYYNADITRTFPVNGKFTERQKLLYNIVLKAQSEVIQMMKPGVQFKALNEKCREILAQECIGIGLIKEAGELSKYYYHGVSHYLGLDTHDVGDREAVLEKGMVLTVEPGLYIEEEGIGIRIEDDVLITEDGHDVLSKNFLKKVEEIEEFMKK